VATGNDLAVPKPLADDVLRILLDQFSLAAGSAILPQSRPSLETVSVDDSQELRPQVQVVQPMAGDTELCPFPCRLEYSQGPATL
jgi:hypothetical protein